MATAVYRRTSPMSVDLVHVAETYEAAKKVASRFKQNRKFNKDTYFMRQYDVFKFDREKEMPEFLHQVLPYPNDHLYYVFSVFDGDGEDWTRREYMNPEVAARLNAAVSPTFCIRAETEEEAYERFRVIRKLHNRDKGHSHEQEVDH